jgi:hypothetical protein
MSAHPPACPHGVYRGDGRFVGLWAAPFDECRCCGAAYPYVDSAWWRSDGFLTSRTWTKGLCSSCGGHYVLESRKAS